MTVQSGKTPVMVEVHDSGKCVMVQLIWGSDGGQGMGAQAGPQGCFLCWMEPNMWEGKKGTGPRLALERL